MLRMSRVVRLSVTKRLSSGTQTRRRWTFASCQRADPEKSRQRPQARLVEIERSRELELHRMNMLGGSTVVLRRETAAYGSSWRTVQPSVFACVSTVSMKRAAALLRQRVPGTTSALDVPKLEPVERLPLPEGAELAVHFEEPPRRGSPSAIVAAMDMWPDLDPTHPHARRLQRGRIDGFRLLASVGRYVARVVQWHEYGVHHARSSVRISAPLARRATCRSIARFSGRDGGRR